MKVTILEVRHGVQTIYYYWAHPGYGPIYLRRAVPMRG